MRTETPETPETAETNPSYCQCGKTEVYDLPGIPPAYLACCWETDAAVVDDTVAPATYDIS